MEPYMNNIDILPYLMAGICLLVFFMVFLLLIFVVKLKSWMPDLFELTREGFIQADRDLQTVSAQGRQEMHQSIALFQESLLKVISENMAFQKQQLDSFEKALDRTTQAILSRQDIFTEKMEKGLQAMERRTQSDGFQAREELKANLTSFEKMLHDHFTRLNQHQLVQNNGVITAIDSLKKAVEASLGSLQRENTRQLGEIRSTVDEKLHETLEKRLGESFQLVSKQLDQVSRGLGEMQSLANGVGDLKRVLSNVKTRGILGEYRLGAILEEILSPHQYARDVVTRKGSGDHVEYAVILPGDGKDHHLFLPVDSKFPLTPYENLQTAFDSGDVEAVKACRATLSRAVLGFARDIAIKYIDPPHTTDFGVMFLRWRGYMPKFPGMWRCLRNSSGNFTSLSPVPPPWQPFKCAADGVQNPGPSEAVFPGVESAVNCENRVCKICPAAGQGGKTFQYGQKFLE